jgi:hypothetical protein
LKASVILAISVCFLTVLGGWPVAANEQTSAIPTLSEWASAQPKDYSPDGREIPFSATPYFSQYHPDSTQAGDGARAGSRWAPVLRFNGTHCRIYVDSTVGSAFSDGYLQNLCAEFDNHIWPVDTDVFGTPGCSTIDIYIYPIDGAGGVGGYYNGGYALYADSSDTSWIDEILAHELQHLIHEYKDNREDLWVNEGCADLAIQLCFGFLNNTTSLQSHIKFFQSKPDNDLTVFQNQLYDYGSAYAFLSYFHDHFGGNSTIRTLVADKARGVNGFNNRLAGTGLNFTAVFRNWTVANFMNNRTIDPAYGYENLSIKVDATRVSDYPFFSNGSVQRWAADYFNFTAEGSDLELEFNGTDSAPLEVWLGLVGKGANPSSVRKMSLDAAKDGFVVIPRLGIDCSGVVMVVSASSASGNYSFTAIAYDRTPPITELNITPPLPDFPDGYYIAPPTLILTANEKRCSTYYHWDNGTDIPYTGRLTASEGRHTLWFHSRDAVGNEEGERSAVIKVDTTAPLTTLRAQPPLPDGRSGWYRTSPSVELSGEVGAKIFYSWDGGPESNYSTPIRPAEGVHTITYRSVDAHDNMEPGHMATFKVDTQAPSFRIYIDPSSPDGLNGWYLRPPTFQLDTEPGSELFYHWNSEALTLYQGPFSGREGRNLLTYYSIDQAGNHQSPMEMDIKVDTRIPRCEPILMPPEPDGLNGFYRSNVSIVLSSELDAAVLYRWDRGKWNDYAGPLFAPEGHHALSYYAVDEAGNPSPESSVELAVDTIRSETSISVDPDKGDLWYSEAPTVSLATSPDAVVYFSLDGDQPRQYNGRMPLVSGRHRLTYWGTDMAGNEGVRMCRALWLDLDDPAAALDVPGPYAMEGNQTYFDGSGSHDDMSGVAAYRFIFGDGEESGWTSSPVAWHSYRMAGTYKASLTVRDAAGRESAQFELVVTVNALGISDAGPAPPNPGSSQAAVAAAASVLVLMVISAALVLRRKRGRTGRTGRAPARRGSPAMRQNLVVWDEDSLKRPERHPKMGRGGP